jgi:hypothetical protein
VGQVTAVSWSVVLHSLTTDHGRQEVGEIALGFIKRYS